MRKLAALLWFACWFACAMAPLTPARAAVTVRALRLPHAATIDPFGPRALMAAAANGSIAATLTVHGYAQRVVVWSANGSYRELPGSATIAAFDGANALLVNDGHPERLTPAWRVEPLDFSSCETFPPSTTGPIVAGTLTNGALIATMLSPTIVDLDDTSGQRAPVVLYLRSERCLNAGNGIALATDGLYTAGYAATIDNVPAPSNVASAKERFVAMRWHDRTGESLGSGVAIAVNAAGAAVGADAPPGNGVTYGRSVQAMLWRNDGTSLQIAPSSRFSAAYAIDERGRVAGMLDDAQHHYAFLWANGTLHRLDDLVRAPGWRFECAYAFAPDGAIVGIGTHNGAPSAFELEGL